MISSSPRAEGTIASTASAIRRIEQIDPDQRQVDGGSFGFSTNRTTRPRPSTSATPNASGSGTGCQEDLAVGAVPLEIGHDLGDSRLEQIVAQVHEDVVAIDPGQCCLQGMRQTGGSVLDDVLDTRSRPNWVPSPTARRISSPVSGEMTMPTSLTPAEAMSSSP